MHGIMLWKLGSDISAGSLPHKPNEADYVQILLNSPSKQVRIVTRSVSADPRSPTCANIKYLQNMTGSSHPQLHQDKGGTSCPGGNRSRTVETWSTEQLAEDELGEVPEEDSNSICAMIDSLSST